jgi:streptomycin 6-kinase
MEEALRDLVPRWQRYWPEADAKRIAADVRQRLRDAAASWRLERLEPLGGGVVALTCAAGDRVVKVLPRGHVEDDVMRGEGIALEHWRNTGASVPLLGARDDGMTLLLPRLRPASDLDDLDYDRQLVEAGTLVRRLHAAGEPASTLPSIDDYVEPYRRAAPDPELDALLADSPPPVAVHADLHGGNVLRDGDRWVAIDPKGVRGDPHLDIWLLLCPQAPALPEDDPARELRRRIQLYADAAGLDPERAARWVAAVARAEAVLSSDSGFSWWTARLARIGSLLA